MNPLRRKISLLTVTLPLLIGTAQGAFAADELFGEIEKISPGDRTMVINKVKYRYSPDVEVRALDGEPQEGVKIDEGYRGAAVYFGARDGDPYPVITYLKPMLL